MLSDEYLTPEQVAQRLSISRDTVIARFANHPDCIDLGTPETRTKRRYRILRIPRETVDQFILSKRVGR